MQRLMLASTGIYHDMSMTETRANHSHEMPKLEKMDSKARDLTHINRQKILQNEIAMLLVDSDSSFQPYSPKPQLRHANIKSDILATKSRLSCLTTRPAQKTIKYTGSVSSYVYLWHRKHR